jgi:hypothetical protein
MMLSISQSQISGPLTIRDSRIYRILVPVVSDDPINVRIKYSVRPSRPILESLYLFFAPMG